MAESPITLPEIVTINDRNLADVDIPDFLNASPFMRTNAATIASHDTIHKWLIYQNPNVGFRAPNDGREVQSSTDTFQDTNCQILDASFRVDLALANSYRKGGASGFVNREAGRHLDAAFFKDEIQVFNGRATGEGGSANISNGVGTGQGDDTGFDGLPNYVTMATLAGGMVVNAGGATDLTSIYVVRSGAQDVEIITGRDGDISIGDTNVQETAGATGTYPALYTPITAWYALKVGSTVTSCVRIANIDAGSNTVTDAMIYSAIEKFGAGRQPTHIYMNRRSLEQLRASRTATNVTGAPAPRPTSVEGFPIVVTDGLTNAETAVA